MFFSTVVVTGVFVTVLGGGVVVTVTVGMGAGSLTRVPKLMLLSLGLDATL